VVDGHEAEGVHPGNRPREVGELHVDVTSPIVVEKRMS
jgi:hypothetical protein